MMLIEPAGELLQHALARFGGIVAPVREAESPGSGSWRSGSLRAFVALGEH
jgi:hypothetical protein